MLQEKTDTDAATEAEMIHLETINVKRGQHPIIQHVWVLYGSRKKGKKKKVQLHLVLPYA